MSGINFGREVCCNQEIVSKREWLVTNGIGGYSSGTVSGVLTRRYHGLLMAAFQPPLGRTLLLAKMDETVEYDGLNTESGRFYPLYQNQWATGDIEPDGHYHLNRFHLEGTIPVWTYAIADALLEKRIWMPHGANTTYIQYRLTRATGPLSIEAKAFINYRDYHGTTIMNDWQPRIEPVDHGLQIRLYEGSQPFYLLSDNTQILPQFDWYEEFYLSQEEYRGQNDIEEDHIYGALIRARLEPGESITLVTTTDPSADLAGGHTLLERKRYEENLIDKAKKVWPTSSTSDFIQQLVLAADQFVVKRPTTGDPDGRSIIAGYHWFGDWGRDTMIALPGLTLVTGRPEIAATILRTFAQFVDQGMIPNRFPDVGEEPEYNTVDASLWYFEAIRAYYQFTGDDELIAELFPILESIIQWHRRGTRYQIHVDEEDSLIYAGEEGIQLTWMDAKVGDWVVTPRIGKAVEINALWYNALCIMGEFAQKLAHDPQGYLELAKKTKDGFGRFWNHEKGYCYDVLDGPDGDDESLRPNQLFAVSLPNCPLNPSQRKSVVDICGRHLFTPHGMRSLSLDDDAFIGHYGGNQFERDKAYHQGTVWGWLIGPFVTAHLRVYQDKKIARSYLQPLIHHLADHGVGSISEIFDGDPPFTPRGCIAQAWSVAEILRSWKETS